MIYTGNPNDSSANQYISNSKYNRSYNDNAYVGYMYGSAGSSTHEATHANTNSSTIKTVIDTWYQNNLRSYSQYIADAIYCNDREVINNFSFTAGEQTMSFTGNGSGTTQTAYASLKRNYIDHNPTLKCTNKNDRFTTSSSLGNGALTYPIGLITTDEIVMAGGQTYDFNTSSYIKNDSYYLYSKSIPPFYWTMTPSRMGEFNAVADVVIFDVIRYSKVNEEFLVRPVVSLFSDAIVGGDGTSGNPFCVGSAPE